MKKMGKILLFATLLILLVAVVSATETVPPDSTGTTDAITDDTSSISHENKQTINNDENMALDENPSKNMDETKNRTIKKKTTDNTKKENIIEVHNYNELASAVDDAERAGVDTTIFLQKGTYNNTGTISWTTTDMVLTIDGNGQTINGQENIVFIIQYDASLLLKNITITNAKNDLGGAIQNSGNLTISNSTFTNNQAGNGGAIQNGGNLTISDSTFTNNQATDEYGGAIHNDGTLTISDSTFKDNQATDEYGGAIYNSDGNLTISDSTFTNNQAIKSDGGAIYNYQGTLTISDSTFTNNQAQYGGAIHNDGTLTISDSTFTNNQESSSGGAIWNGGTLTISDSTFTNNQAYGSGGAIYDLYSGMDIISCNFTDNTAMLSAAIYSSGYVNLTGNNFTKNIATGNKETINLFYSEAVSSGNSYVSTDISLNEISLNVKENQETFTAEEDIVLNFTIQPTNGQYYKDFSEGISDITLYINDKKNVTVKYENYTLKGLKPGEYNVYFTSCNRQSNTVTFKVMGGSEISTDDVSYDYYEGIKNVVQLDITDEIGQRGTAEVSVKDGEEYVPLLTCHNVKDGYTIQTVALVEALENIYEDLDSSYTINVTYYNNYTNPSSTEFTLNIIKQRNTSIIYDIINNTEGNVQINITVTDTTYQSPIANAPIIVTGDINTNTTSGVLKDNKLTQGNYKINIYYDDTEEYKASNATIVFTVEIDKDEKIAQLEKENKQLTEQLNQTNNQINKLNNYIDKLLNTTKLNTTITINPIKSTVGSLVTLTAKIKDEKGNAVTDGKVIFKINGITLKDKNKNTIYAIVSNATATIKYIVQTAWNKNTSYIEAVYGGSNKYAPSRTNSTTALQISQGTAKITLTPTQITAKTGQKITLKAKVTDTTDNRINSEKVVFKLNGKTLTDNKGNKLYAKVIDGEAILNYTIPSTYNAKTYNLTAVFGEKNYKQTTTTGKLTIEKKAVEINITNITTKKNKTTIKAKIYDETGKQLVRNTKLAIKINEKTVLTNINSTNGIVDVSFITSLKQGLYELLIISGENGIYKSAKVTTVLKI